MRTWQPAVKRCSKKQSGYNKIPGYILAATWHTRIYKYAYTNSQLEGGYSRGDMPTLIRFGGGLNAVSPIVTSWTAWGRACGFFLSFPFFFSLFKSWLVWQPLFLLGCFFSSSEGSDAGLWHLLLNLSPLDSCMPGMPAYTRVYLRMPAYACVCLRLFAYDLFLTDLLFTFRSTQWKSWVYMGLPE